MKLYEPALQVIQSIPRATRVALVVRHSIRYPILSEEDVYTAGLTPEGITVAEEFGQMLGKIRAPGHLFTSPVNRCIDTGAAISRGANWNRPPKTDYRLSHPFIEPVWSALPIRWPDNPMPAQVGRLLRLILDGEEAAGLIDIFTTHDTIVAVLAGYFFGVQFNYPTYWPDYLEGVLAWRDEGCIHLYWRKETIAIPERYSPAAHQLELQF